MTAPTMEQMNKLIVEHVVKATLSEIKLKNGKPALTLYGEHTHLHINPSGKSAQISAICRMLYFRWRYYQTPRGNYESLACTRVSCGFRIDALGV